jgi:hypothetical protein
MTKIRSICVDTLTALQTDEYMTVQKKPDLAKWHDFGQSIYKFINDLQDLGFTLILVLGQPGVGKSSGMRTLKPNTNVWYNADNKNPVWEGGNAEYGKKVNPRPKFHVIPKTYADIIDHIKAGIAAGAFEEDRYAFITGHTENFKSGEETMERLKLLGNVATKMQLEGKLETVFYAKVKKEGANIHYMLETQNNGYNTARSPQNLFEPTIDNDYQFVIDKLTNY